MQTEPTERPTTHFEIIDAISILCHAFEAFNNIGQNTDEGVTASRGLETVINNLVQQLLPANQGQINP